MKVLFYSDKCQFCSKLLEYLHKYNIIHQFKLIDIEQNNIPADIDIVPTIIDTDLTQPQKGKQAFEYLLNIKYFNNPTNNIDYLKELPPNPKINEDKLANTKDTNNLDLDNKSNFVPDYNINESKQFYEDNKNNEISKVVQNMTESRQSQDKNLAILLRMRKK